ncbi:MAG: ABC transporter substrate-binding protein [Actinobacteria bacterium]|nr:ABC transporter substrate-binding protein [Actinomycetota bacterium]
MRRSSRCALGMTVLALLFAGGCGGGQPAGPAPQPSADALPGGTYTYPLSRNPEGIEPKTIREREGMQVAHQVFQGLAAYELQPDGALLARPALAESWTVDASATVFTFHLRRGVRFQPPVAREVTAADVARSWDRITDARRPAPLARILAPIRGLDERGKQTDEQAGLAGVAVLDRYTLRVTLRYPFAEFPQTLGHPVAAVTPVDYIAHVGEAAYARAPVGTGPYRVQSWRKGEGIQLVAVSEYWNKSERPQLDRISMPVIADTADRWRRFAAGELDIIRVSPGWRRDAATRRHVGRGEWLVQAWPRLSVRLIGIRMTDGELGGASGEAGLARRRALALATDADAVAAALHDVPLAGTGVVPPGVPGFRDAQTPYDYDPPAAIRLLEETGHPKLQVSFADEESTESSVIAATLARSWREVGIVARRKQPAGLPSPPATDDSPLFALSWTADYPSMDAFLSPLFHSGGHSGTQYHSETVDGLLYQARATLDDVQRQNFYAQAEKTILADAACIPLCFERDLWVNSTRIASQVVDPLGFIDMWKLYRQRRGKR